MIELLVVLVVVGVVLYLVNNYVPMAAPIKTIINVVVVLAVCIWLLRVTGIVNIPMSFGRL
jgi:uncharacterized membrane-anchored protein